MCDTTSNPIGTPVTPGLQLLVVANASASFTQQIVLSFNRDMSNPIGTLQGSGENVAMEPATGIRFNMGGNNTLWAQFNFQEPGGDFQPSAQVCKPITRTFMTTIASEDTGDNDDNDSFLIIIVTSP